MPMIDDCYAGMDPAEIPLDWGEGIPNVARGEEPTKRGIIEIIKDKITIRRLRKEIVEKDRVIEDLSLEIEGLKKQRGIYR